MLRHHLSEVPNSTMSALVRRRWLWIVLFIVVALLLTILATGWNLVLVRDYRQMVALARQLTRSSGSAGSEARAPWGSLILGTLGFVATLAMLMVFFFRLLQEMRLNQLQSEFLAAMSHELKSPIASMELSTSLIRAGGLLAGEADRLWQSHDAELKRLREQVETILEAARWQAHPARAERAARGERIDLEQWLRDSLERWRAMLGPSAELRREGAPLRAVLTADPRALNLVTDNLIDNSRKFARGQPKVTVRTRQGKTRFPGSHARWEIEFRDQGWGFDPGDSRRVFDRFYRAHHGARQAIPGTGLGLFLAKTAGKSLGIRLHGESEGIGKGAVFVLQGRDEGGNGAN